MRKGLRSAPFEAALAFAALISSAVYLVDPAAAHTSALGKTARTLTPLWEVLYVVGGLLILFGLARSLRVEAAGLCLFIAAVLINAFAVIDVAGLTGAVTASTFAAIAIAGVVRLRVLYRAWHVVVVEDG